MTEDVCQKSKGFDQWSTLAMVEAMHEGQLAALSAIKPAFSNIAAAAEAAAKRLGDNGRLIYAGAGTSGRLAVLDAVELGPTFGWPQERTVYCLAGGESALTVSAEGAEDKMDDGAAQIRAANTCENDVVIGVAASGTTPFTRGVLSAAKEMGAMTIAITNTEDAPLLENVDHPVLAKTGSEIIAGSTRMKAGTAQKIILNMISTAIMTKRGHVYNGLMVDMKSSNKKLENRAINMVGDITGCSKGEAITALKSANQHIKTACLIALGQGLENSKRILISTNGNLRSALEAINHV